MDAGDGVTTSYVLGYCRTRRRRNILAIKGQSQANKPEIGRPTKVDIGRKGGPVSGSALLWPVGSDTIKGWLMGRLKAEGMVHFPAGFPDDFYDQLTSERLVTKHLRGMPRREWVKASSARNEALDATVYAYAAAVHAGLKRANWANLRARIAPKDEATEQAAVAAAVVKAQTKPPRGGFVNGWRR